MGVDLGDLVAREPAQIEDFKGSTVAIDAYNTLYQFLSTIRQADGTPLKDSKGRVTSHLSGLFQRTAYLVEAGIRPIYVFDGAPHPLKLATLQERTRIRHEAERAYHAALARGDLETARMKAQQTTTLSKDMVAQSKALLDALGVSWLDAPSEGEAQASQLARGGEAQVCASQDYDSVLFGAPILLRNLSVGGRRKVPGKQVWTDVPLERVDLDPTLGALGLSREQLVDLAILMGTDYNPGVRGVGPKTALKLVKECGRIEDVRARAEKETGAVWVKVREDHDRIEPLEELRRIFLKPDVLQAPAIARRPLEEDAVRGLLVDDFGFGAERIASTLARYKTGRSERAQSRLGEF